MTEDAMVGWHHRLDGHESEQTLGDGEGQGSQACCSLWGHKQLDTTHRLNNSKHLNKAREEKKIQSTGKKEDLHPSNWIKAGVT